MAPAPQEVAQEAPAAPAVEPVLYGVDLDTVRAGRFDGGKMWTFEFPPVDYFRETYDFEPDSAWFRRARLGALRIPGCSASFVSPYGLVLTNHHCAREFVTQVSGEGEALLDKGFVARDLADERELEDFEADQLVEIIDVTAEVDAALEGLDAQAQAEARDSVLEALEARLLEERGGEDAGFVVEMISLYDGARTSAYVFRRYTHARLVMAPELQIGFFGGDPDNFTYPRYNLDFAFFRIYDDEGRPLRTEHYFPVDDEGLKEDDAVFVVGNPGSTHRLQTVAELEFRRDIQDRALLATIRSRMSILEDYMEAHPEETEAYDLRNEYFGLSNAEKAYEGQLRGLEDPVIMARKRDGERRFIEAVEADSALAARYGGLVDRMAELQRRKREHAPVIRAFSAFGNPYLDAATLIRGFYALQVIAMRQNGAPEDDISSMVENLEEVPDIPEELDVQLLAARIEDLQRELGGDHPAVQQVLGGGTPEEAARAVVEGSVLADSASAVRAIEDGTVSPNDPAIQAMVAILPAFLELNQLFSQVGPEEDAVRAELGRARFAVYGTEVPPDATFSLRIADGVVRGYPYNGTVAPPFTTLFGMYDRHYGHAREDWDLPQRWLEAAGTLELATPLNFVSTADIIGGNSGSPVLDRELEVVGVVFDGNIESLPGDYIYLPDRNRAVTVDIRAVLEALDQVYDADRLVVELTRARLVETEREADAVGR